LRNLYCPYHGIQSLHLTDVLSVGYPIFGGLEGLFLSMGSDHEPGTWPRCGTDLITTNDYAWLIPVDEQYRLVARCIAEKPTIRYVVVNREGTYQSS
jgi:hypothetical protein